MIYYIVGTHNDYKSKGEPQVYWSKNRRAFVPRGEAQDAWDVNWGSESSAKAYARRYGIPTDHVSSYPYPSSFSDMDVTRFPFSE